MGSIIGAGIGAAGSIIGAQQSAKAAKQSAQIQAAAADRAGERALTGYKYLTEGAGGAPIQSYINAGQTALRNQGGVQNMMMDLLGVNGYMNSGQNGQGGAGAGGDGQAPQQAHPNALAQPGAAGGLPLYPSADFDYGPYMPRMPVQAAPSGPTIPYAGGIPSGPGLSSSAIYNSFAAYGGLPSAYDGR